MPDVYLQPYIISVRKKHFRRDLHCFPFENIVLDEIHHDAFLLLADKLKRIQGYQIDRADRQVWSISDVKSQNRILSGLIKSGEYGYQADIVDTSNNEIAHRKTLTQAEQYPHYFLIYLPNEMKRGIILISKRGVRSVARIFCDKIAEIIESAIEGLICDIETYMDASLFEQDIAAKKVRKMRYFLRNISTDEFDRRDDDLIAKAGQIILEFKVKQGQWYDKIAKNLFAAVNGGKELLDVVSLPRGYEYEKVKVVVERAGRDVTYDLSAYQDATAKIDITSNINISEKTGHPTFASYDAVAKFHLQYLARSIHITEP